MVISGAIGRDPHVHWNVHITSKGRVPFIRSLSAGRAADVAVTGATGIIDSILFLYFYYYYFFTIIFLASFVPSPFIRPRCVRG